MEDQKQTSFTFEMDNFSDKECFVYSPKFSSGGCEWFVRVYPKGYIVDEHLSLFLCVANPKSLRLGWKRRASYTFALLNESGKELVRTTESSLYCQLFCAQFSAWGVVTGNETFDYYGFQILNSQVVSVGELFTKHPDIDANFRPKNQLAKTTYMNLLLGLIETLDKPPHSITDTELGNAQNDLIELTDLAGFKLDWLKKKFDEVSLERKKPNGGDDTQVQEHIKNLNLELEKEKVKSATYAARVLSMEKTVSDLNDEVLNLKDERNKEKGKSNNYAAKVWSMEQTVSDLKDELDKEKREAVVKIVGLKDEVSDLEHEVFDLETELNKEKGKSNACDAKVMSLEQTVSDLKDELDKEKHKSAAKVLLLNKTVSDLEDELNREKGRSADEVWSLEQTVLNLRAELNKEKAAACSWEVLDYEDLPNDK
ncbi:unnamed protein product [Microthlaspi erraticum]|uniref:MATH domain-containing protein n=1 Tax=Microthlaspi erraticum TaxID=1685480 RepID=A0A6D2K6G7_9BRAS|nr:unnamed protein product [Microthlaspi erraticum]